MGPPSSLKPSFWKLPQSITSLAIDSAVVTLVQVRDVMTRLPNLDNLELSGSLVALDRRELSGIGSVVRGRFGGQLALSGECVHEDVINMLLEIPSGLRFTAVRIYCAVRRLHSAVRAAEACCETVVKLSLLVIFHGKFHPWYNEI